MHSIFQDKDCVSIKGYAKILNMNIVDPEHETSNETYQKLFNAEYPEPLSGRLTARPSGKF